MNRSFGNLFCVDLSWWNRQTAWHTSIVVVLMLCVLSLRSDIVLAQDTLPVDDRRSKVFHIEIDHAPHRDAVDRGMRWLSSVQHTDGSWGSGAFRGSVAVTSSVMMAMLSAGNTSESGEYAQHVDRAVEFLMRAVQPSGLVRSDEAASHGPMYGHAFATTVLADLIGECRRKELPNVIGRCYALMESSQNEQGGWRYRPERGDADISVTSAMLIALRAVADSGQQVDEQIVRRAVAYIESAQNDDGGFRYQLEAGAAARPRTAAALAAIMASGFSKTSSVDRGLKWLETHPVHLVDSDGYTLYGLSYAAQAYRLRGTDAFDAFRKDIFEPLMHLQKSDGSWSDPSCAEYGTSAAIIVLLMENSPSPLFAR